MVWVYGVVWVPIFYILTDSMTQFLSHESWWDFSYPLLFESLVKLTKCSTIFTTIFIMKQIIFFWACSWFTKLSHRSDFCLSLTYSLSQWVSQSLYQNWTCVPTLYYKDDRTSSKRGRRKIRLRSHQIIWEHASTEHMAMVWHRNVLDKANIID